MYFRSNHVEIRLYPKILVERLLQGGVSHSDGVGHIVETLQFSLQLSLEEFGVELGVLFLGREPILWSP